MLYECWISWTSLNLASAIRVSIESQFLAPKELPSLFQQHDPVSQSVVYVLMVFVYMLLSDKCHHKVEWLTWNCNN